MGRIHTGRIVVEFDRGTARDVLRSLSDRAGLDVAAAASHTDFASDPAAALGHPAVVLDELGVAAFAPPTLDPAGVSVALEGPIRRIRPERVLRRPQTSIEPSDDVPITAAAGGTSWALREMGIDDTVEGEGVRIALLDGGVDVSHPDLAGRVLDRTSFVSAPADVDVTGHGTHCAGLLVGSAAPQTGPRYGIAPRAELVIARIFDEHGEAAEIDVLRAATWAFTRHAVGIISISAGHDGSGGATPGDERSGEWFAERGVLIVACAGNESDRAIGIVAPTNAPANAHGIVAVGAINFARRLWNRSNGSEATPAARVDLVAPGVSVPSARPGGGVDLATGTSVSTPLVAGAAAVWWSRDSSASLEDVSRRLRAAALALTAEPREGVGSGLARV